ncbi:MAG TPA: disulfide oxidoreductase [Miltoncostaeaceae bacterium]|nr:disulfide oxidoreductase [Miltoncostaeaceae bacterium]
MIETVNHLLGALGILAQIAIVAIVALLVAARLRPAAVGRLVGTPDVLMRQALWTAWVVAAVATGASLYLSEIADYVPCRLCWFQRIAMYPLAVVLLVGALRRDRRVVSYAAAFPVVGAGIAAYHIYIERNPEAESQACRLSGAPCSTKWIEEFGYLTIPTLALTAFVLIAVLLAVVHVAGRRAER